MGRPCPAPPRAAPPRRPAAGRDRGPAGGARLRGAGIGRRARAWSIHSAWPPRAPSGIWWPTPRPACARSGWTACTSVGSTGDKVVRPDGFDLAEAWRLITDEVDQRRTPAWAKGSAVPEAVPYLRMSFGPRVRIGPTDVDGRVEVELRGRSAFALAASWRASVASFRSSSRPTCEPPLVASAPSWWRRTRTRRPQRPRTGARGGSRSPSRIPAASPGRGAPVRDRARRRWGVIQERGVRPARGRAPRGHVAGPRG